MLGKIKHLFDHFLLSDKLPLDKRIFNLLAGFGFLASLAAIISRIIENAPLHNILVTLSLPAILLLFLIACNIYNIYRFGMIITLAACCNIVFPLVFFTSGGAGNGMVGYFVLNMVLTLMLLHGRACMAMMLSSITVIIATYAVDYFFPGLHTPPGSNIMRYVDNVHGWLVSGLFVGALVKFQTAIHLEEAQKAEAASEAKGAFLASVSHVIRTPLNAIMGISELQMRKEGKPETRENMEKIYSSGLTLLNIINDILDISRIESGKFQLMPADYDVASSINDTISLNIIRIGSKNIQFAVDIDENMPAVLHGDELRIKQILNNILSNAFKYTSEGEVRFSVECERDRQMAWITIAVSDTGVGIRPEDRARLFADFKQFHTEGHARQEGTGLGLSIAKSLTEMMGGAIMVHSEYGKGSTFKIVFPQIIVDHAPLGKELTDNLSKRQFVSQRYRETSIEHERMPHARVLLVDDVEINLMVAESIMEPYGMTIDCVTSGKEAVRLIKEHSVTYDAIFMDHMMPEMDGMEAVRIIREDIGTEYARAVPIIALTANALVGNEEMFLANGFQAFLPKPIDTSRLDEVLKTWVKKQPQRQGGKP